MYKNRGDLGRTPTFSQTDISLSHSYKFGRDNGFKIVGDININNLFNQNIVTAINPRRWIVDAPDPNALLAAGGYTGVGDPGQFIENALGAGRLGAVYDALDTIPGNLNSIYKQPSAYQAKRNIRFGFRLVF